MANLATINNNILADSGIDPISVVLGSGTANQIAYWIDADNIGALTTATYPSLTELSYVKGVTSSIQTQLNAKQATLTLTTTGTSGAATLVGATLNIPQYQSVLTNPVTGTGTANYIPKWTSASAIGNSNIVLSSGANFVEMTIGSTSGATNNYNTLNILAVTEPRIYLTASDGFNSVLYNSYGSIGLQAQFSSPLVNNNIFYYDGSSATNRSLAFQTEGSNRITINQAGTIRFNAYGGGTITGTRAYDLAVDASGNIIEVAVGAGTVTGTGTANYHAKWVSGSAIGNSLIYDDGTLLGINTTTLTKNINFAGTFRYERVYAYGNYSANFSNAGGLTTAWFHLGSASPFSQTRIFYRAGSSTSEEEGEIRISNTCAQPFIEWTRNTYNYHIVEVRGRMTGGCGQCEVWALIRYGNFYGGADTNFQWQIHGGTDSAFAVVNATGTPGTGTTQVSVSTSNGYFYANSGDMYIANTIGLGTTSPSAQLHIKSGGSYVNTDANNRIIVERDAHTYLMFVSPNEFDQGIHFAKPTGIVGRIAYFQRAAGDAMAFTVASGVRMTLFNTGNLYLGSSTAVDSGFRLEVEGAGKFTGNVSIYTAGYPALNLGINSSNQFTWIYDNPNANLLLQKNGSTKITISETGASTFVSTISATTLTANTGLITSVGTNAFVDINGSTSGTLAGVRLYSDGSTKWIISHSTPSSYNFSIGTATSATTFTERFGINYSTGVATISNLAGTGSRIVVADASGNLSASSALSGYVTGSGTTNYVPKFTSSSAVGNSLMYDNGTSIVIGGTGVTSSEKFRVSGGISANGLVRFENSVNQADVNHGTLTIVNTAAYAIGNDASISFALSRADDSYQDPRASIGAKTESSYGAALVFNTRLDSGTYSEKVRITGNGSLLVGTPINSGYKFDVVGTGRFTSSVTASGVFSNNISSFTYEASNAGAIQPGVSEFISTGFNVAGASSTDISTISLPSNTQWKAIITGGFANNYEGGGLTSPSFSRDIDGTNSTISVGSVTLTFSRNSTTGKLQVSNGNASYRATFVGTIHLITFPQSAFPSTTRAFFGNVGIGVASASYKLHVEGSVGINGTTIPISNNTYSLGGGGNKWSQIWGARYFADDGTVNTPSYSFAGDQDSGIWKPGDGIVAFSTNGVERIRIDGANFGVGSASPNRTLTLSGTYRHERIYAYGNNPLSIANSVSFGTVWVHLGTAGAFTTDKIYYRVGTNTSEEEGEIIVSNTCSEPSVEWRRNTYNPMVVQVRARMQGGCGNCEVWIQVRYGSDYGGANTNLNWQVYSGTDSIFATVNATGTPGSGTTEKSISSTDTYFYANANNISALGRIGVGTTAPVTLLHTYSTSNADTIGHIQYENGNTGTGSLCNAQLIGKSRYGTAQLMVWENYGIRFGMRSVANGGVGSITFTTGTDSTGMVLTSSNRLLVGGITVDSGYTLDVSGSSRITGQLLQGSGAARSTNGTTIALTNNTTFVANTDIGDGARFLSIVNESTVTSAFSNICFRINPASGGSSGNVMLDMKFVNNGSVTSTLYWTFLHGGAWSDRMSLTSAGALTAVSFFESSDARLKSKIINLDVDVSSIIAKHYVKEGIEEIGYLAQDVENILPSAISKRSDGYLDLSYRQVHTAKIAYLEKRITELEQQLKNK